MREPEQKKPGGLILYPSAHDRIVRQAHTAFLAVVSLCVVGLLTWAALAEIDRTTRGSGRVVPQTQNQIVQHLEGGIVTEILVREGDRIELGQPLLRIEDTTFRADHAQEELDLKAKLIRLARLEAEISQSESFTIAAELEQAVPEIASGERQVRARRSAKLDEELSILDEQIRQKRIEVSELRSRKPSIDRAREINQEQYENLARLSEIGAVSRNDLLDAERLYQQSLTQSSDLAHAIPRAESAISETERRKAEIIKAFQSDAERERSDTLVEIAKHRERISAMQERRDRSYVRAPVSGIVNRLLVSTVGGVARPGEPLVQIVSSDTKIAIEMKLRPSDRASVWTGQKAVVKVSAYEYSTHGALRGSVVDVSPDALQDEQGSSYFRVRLEADAAGFGADKPIVPGMMADVDLIAGRHTVLSYILKPIRSISENAFRN